MVESNAPVTVDLDKLAAANPTVVPATAPATASPDKIKPIIDAMFEAAKVALRRRPALYIMVVSVDAAIDALWDTIFPATKAKLTEKGISV